MRHGSLFSGIGGFDLAAEWMGWTNVFHCEWNEFGQRVLKHYWPDAISYGDITKTDFTVHRGDIDILTGGFPCQPYSMAGKRKGKEDERHLWPEMLRAIREIKPTWVVGENVFGITNWDGGVVFNEVQADLEAEGYEVQPYVLPACAVNAPHRRDRVWFVAHAKSVDAGGASGLPNNRDEGHKTEDRGRPWDKPECDGSIQFITNTETKRLEGNDWRQLGRKLSTERTSFEGFPTVSPLCGGDDGLPDRLSGITFSKWRNESIKAMGNAIVPQVAYQIFKAIEQFNNL
jgi:DNA (cytosine-5)-methyltransferase 1